MISNYIYHICFRLYVQMNTAEYAKNQNFKLLTTFPKKIFTADEYEMSLESLGKAYYS